MGNFIFRRSCGWLFGFIGIFLVLGIPVYSNPIDQISSGMTFALERGDSLSFALRLREANQIILNSADQNAKAQEIFNSFLKSLNEAHNLDITRHKLLNYLLSQKSLVTNDSINSQLSDFLCRDHLPGECSPWNILGLLEVGVGTAICLASAWTGAGAVVGGTLIGHGMAQILDSEYENMRNNGTWPFPPQNQYPH